MSEPPPARSSVPGRRAGRLIIIIGTFFGVVPMIATLAVGGSPVLLLPGFAVYFGLLKKLRGRPTWLDPYGVWIGAILMNAVWAGLVVGLLPRITVIHLVVLPPAVVSLIAGVIGLLAERRAR